METVKLQKFFSDCGIMSRRKAEDEIKAGHVRVNGITASLGDRIDPGSDSVEYKGRTVQMVSSAKIYIALNKPAGYVTTMSDEKDRKTVSDLVSGVKERVYPVGRLDMYSDGLLLMTNDGELANRLTHPSHDISKCYLATVTSKLTEDDVRNMCEPFEIDGYMLRPFEISLKEYTKCSGKDSTVLLFTLHEGRNREIRKICEHHGLKIARLTRISVGKIELGSLEGGKWRFLSDEEISYLKTV